MQQTISYININNKNHQSLYKYYYIKKLNKNIIDIDNFMKNTNHTSFIFYGNRRAIPPLKRIECNKFFNKNTNEIKVNLSILPYNSFQSILRFSSIKSIKNMLKGEVFYQIEIQFNHNLFNKSAKFEIESKRYFSIYTQFSQYMNPNIVKTSSLQFVPSIRFIPKKQQKDSILFIRYNYINKWINQFNYKVDNVLSYNLIKLIIYNLSLKSN